MMLIALIALVVGPSAADAGLTLTDAIALATTRHERPFIALAGQDAAAARFVSRRSALLPHVDLNASAQRRMYDYSRDGMVWRRLDGADAVVDVRIPLLHMEAVCNTQAEQAAVQAATLDRAEEERQVAFAAAELFLTALKEAQVYTASVSRVDRAQAQLDDVQARFAAGLLDASEVSQAQIEHALAKGAMLQAEQNKVAAWLALQSFIHAPLPDTLTPPAELLRAAQIAELSQHETLHQTLEHRLDVQAQKRTIEALGYFAQGALWRWAPTLEAVAYARIANEVGFYGKNYDGYAGLNLHWNVFEGGASYAQYAEQQAFARRARFELTQHERDIALAVAQARASVEHLRLAEQQAQRTVQLGHENMIATQVRYRQGLADAVAQTLATTQLFAAETELAKTHYELAVAYVALRRAQGVLPQGLES